MIPDRSRDADIARALAPLEVLPSPGRQLTKETIAVYVACLRDLTPAELTHAVEQVLLHERFYPAPAQIRGYARAERDYRLEAMRVFDAIRRLAQHNPVSGTYYRADEIRDVLGDAAAEAFTACGGTAALKGGDDDREYWVRKDFAAAYADIAPHHPVPTLPAPTPRRALPRGAKAVSSGNRVLSLVAKVAERLDAREP